MPLRDAISASLPALAGALQEAGLTLTGGGVSQHMPQGQGQGPGQQPQGQGSPGGGRAAGERGSADAGAAGPAVPGVPTPRAAPRGLVDLVA